MQQSKRQKRLLNKRIMDSVSNPDLNPFNPNGIKAGQVFYMSKTHIGTYVRHKKS